MNVNLRVLVGLILAFFASAISIVVLLYPIGLCGWLLEMAPTPTPTPPRILSLGELVAFQPPRAPASMLSDGKGVSIGVMEYTVSDRCPVEEGEASGWTKFIAIRLYAENPNREAVRVFPQELSLQRNGEKVGVDWGRASEEGKQCYGDWLYTSVGRELQHGESCEGWAVFEVMPTINPEELVVVAEWGDPLAFVALWRLGP